VVNDLLVEHFPQIVDLEFTAQMEEHLDEIARGEKKWQPVISDFYTPFKKNLEEKKITVEKNNFSKDEPTDEKCEKCGSPMVIKMGRYGKFMACSGYPACKNIKNIENKTNVKCPKCGDGDIVERRSRRGKIFYSCNQYPKCEFALWDRPTGEKCEQCGSLITKSFRGVIKCSNKECGAKAEEKQ
jgi:DNA topoisomerase-1